MAATTALDKIKVVLGGEPSVKQDNKQESQSLEEIGDCCPSTLTREQVFKELYGIIKTSKIY